MSSNHVDGSASWSFSSSSKHRSHSHPISSPAPSPTPTSSSSNSRPRSTSIGIKATSHDLPLSLRNPTTRFRRGSTSASSSNRSKHSSTQGPTAANRLNHSSPNPDIAVDSTTRAPVTIKLEPSRTTNSTFLSDSASYLPQRPLRSPLRPRLPSIARRRRVSEAAATAYISTSVAERKRQDSGLSIGGIEKLREVLRSFRQSLRPEPLLDEDRIASLESENEKQEEEEGRDIQGKDEDRPRQRLSSLTLSGLFGNRRASDESNMSLSDQRSTQRLIDELMEELTPRSPTGSIGPPTPPVPVPRHVERVRRAGGHRRTYSSPGSVTRTSSPGDPRGRTLSGGTFGRALGAGSEGLMSDVETLRSGRAGNGGGTASAPISPAATTAPLPPVQLPLIAARSNGDPMPETIQMLRPPVRPALTVLPSPLPLSPPSNERSHRPPLILTSPPLVTPPETQLPSPSLPDPSGPLPPTPRTPSHRSSTNVQGAPATHPFAAVVAMMEGGDSPSNRRSRMESKSAEGLNTAEKGKARSTGERPGTEGRKQKPRRGIGPASFIPRIASRASLAKLRGAQAPQPSESHPIIVPIPPSPPSTAPLPESQYIHPPRTPATPASLTPDSSSYLRPAPATPLTPFWAKPRFAVSTSRQPSPSSSRQPTPTHVPRSGSGIEGLPQPGRGEDLIEIPRFKKKELNLGIVRRRGPNQKIAWLALWAVWLFNGLLSLFFDVNVVYILIQCTIHPSFDTNSSKTWQFATAAYIVLWAISILAVWLAWEVGYEFWRRWRLLEPIYLSLPASLHLSLISFNHFTFLLHIRTSPLGTPHSRDIIPETAHALLQLLPGLLPLLPRAAITVVVLISFWEPAADVQAPFGGSVDEKSNRDPSFFRSDSPGQLTGYAKGVLLTFTVWIALRLIAGFVSGIVLWSFSQRPLGGLFGHTFTREQKRTADPPTTPKRKPKSSIQPRDPSTSSSPQKSWIEQENEFDWAWRERSSARVQDAFELCMIRRGDRGMGSFLYQSEIPWGRRMEQRPTGQVSSGRTLIQTPIEMETPGPSKTARTPISTDEFIGAFIEGRSTAENGDRPTNETTSSSATPKSAERPRPESTLDPTATARANASNSSTLGTMLHPSPSRANTAASSSTTDLFYTPADGHTPQTEKTRSAAEGVHRLPAMTLQGKGPPPSAFKPSGVITEFGVKEPPPGRSSVDSGEGEDESTGLLSGTTATPSPRNSIPSRVQSGSNASNAGSNDHSGSGSGSGSRSSSRSRRRAYTAWSQRESLNRARSSSIGLLRERVVNTAAASGSFVRRARSGTVLSSDTAYSKMSKGQDDEEEAMLDHGEWPAQLSRPSFAAVETGNRLRAGFTFRDDFGPYTDDEYRVKESNIGKRVGLDLTGEVNERLELKVTARGGGARGRF